MENNTILNYFWQNELVKLRPMILEDWELIYKHTFNSQARLYLYGELSFPKSEQVIKEFITNNSKLSYSKNQLYFSIENLNVEFVGILYIHSIDEKNGSFGCGIQIWHNYLKKGYGTAAMKIVLKYGFLERRLNKFIDIVLEGNLASQKMMEKLGCKLEGTHRQQVFFNNRYYDELYYGLLKDEYLNIYG